MRTITALLLATLALWAGVAAVAVAVVQLLVEPNLEGEAEGAVAALIGLLIGGPLGQGTWLIWSVGLERRRWERS